jgi:hypothetical protein
VFNLTRKGRLQPCLLQRCRGNCCNWSPIVLSGSVCHTRKLLSLEGLGPGSLPVWSVFHRVAHTRFGARHRHVVLVRPLWCVAQVVWQCSLHRQHLGSFFAFSLVLITVTVVAFTHLRPFVLTVHGTCLSLSLYSLPIVIPCSSSRVSWFHRWHSVSHRGNLLLTPSLFLCPLVVFFWYQQSHSVVPAPPRPVA